MNLSRLPQPLQKVLRGFTDRRAYDVAGNIAESTMVADGYHSSRVRLPNAHIQDTTVIEARGLQRLGIGPVDLKIQDGECVSIMGRSGSGKSILLRMIADLDPHSGDALLDGVPCSSMRASTWRGLVTYVPAESGWWSERVADHFAAEAPARDLLPAVGFPADALEWPLSRLSTGERQRFAILRAIQAKTRVLLLDEPTSGLDTASVTMMETFLRKRLEAGTSILLVTHDPQQSARMATRHCKVHEGRLIEDRA